MNDMDIKGYLSEDSKKAILRDAIDFLPITYISEEDKIKVTEYLEELFECKYEPIEVPVKTIIEMIKNGTWEGSLEQEEIEFNVEHKLYPVKQLKQYTKLLAKIKEK